MTKIRITTAGIDGYTLFATLSDGRTLRQRTTCRPYAYDHLIRDIASITGQTDRGVKASLRRWFS